MPKNRVRRATALALALLLSGCAASPEVRAEDEPDVPVVLVTFTVLADIAAQVGGDLVDVVSLTAAGTQIHGYEPTPGDMRRAAEADLVLENGLGLEEWFARFIDAVDVPHVVVSEGIEPLGIEGDPNAPNPHAWASPIAGEQYVENIVAALSELVPEGAETFAANGARYTEQLRALAADVDERLSALPAEHRTLVTCEGAFSYLARDVGLEEAYLWAVNAEQQVRPQQMTDLVDLVDERDVPAVFCESTVDPGPMQQVADATGARLAGTLYVDSLSAADGPVPTYLDLVRHNTDLIVEGLEGAS